MTLLKTLRIYLIELVIKLDTRLLLVYNMNKRKASINIPSIVYLEQPKFLHYHIGAEFLAFIPKKPQPVNSKPDRI